MEQINARKTALSTLVDMDEKGSYSNILLNKKVSNAKMSYQDRRFVSQLVYGVIENKILIDYQIKKYSKTKINKINSYILNDLRLGIYQLLFLDKTPNSAAVNEAVNLAKKKYPQFSGFVNGILRNVIRGGLEPLLPERNKGITAYLSVKYSHPEWIVDRWLARYGEEFTEGLLEANNMSPKLVIRPNLLRTSAAELIASLVAEGYEVRNSDLAKNSIVVVSQPKSLLESDMFRDGMFSVQDEAASLAVEVLDPSESDRVLDMCAAPGGKSIYIAELMNNKGELVSRDIYPHKLQLMESAITKNGIENITLELFDGKDVDSGSLGAFDKVMLDAPCSGFGIIRRKPEIRYNKTAADIEGLAELQESLLNNAAEYVKVGGELVYCTCSIENEENAAIVEKFIGSNGDRFEISDIRGSVPEFVRGETPYIQLMPNLHGSDGFFITKFKRVR